MLSKLIWLPILTAAVVASAQDASARCVRLLQSNGWGDRIVCNNSGGGGYGGGGGGFNYGAAAAVGVGVIGLIAHAAEQQRINEANERIAESNRAIAAENARRAACNRNLDVAIAATNQGNAIFDRWDPGGAIPFYERAAATLSICGDSRNIAIVRRNLEVARKQYAAIMPDTRVSDAQQYANQNIYNAPNPFASSASGASRGAGRQAWSGLRDDCKLAGPLEQQTASWFNVCVWDGTKKAERYKPSIDPQKLSIRAKEQCQSAAEQEFAECVIATKTRILMSEDSDIRRSCSGAAEKLIECVDIHYVYGPQGRLQALRATIALKLGKLGGADTAPPNASAKVSNDKVAAANPADGSAEADAAAYRAALREHQNRRFDEVAAAAVHAAVEESDSAASSDERRNCVATAYQAVRAQMTGGNPPVPAQCAALVDIARSRLAYYAAMRVDTGPSTDEDPLKLYLAARNSNSNAPNDGKLGTGFVGLTPHERVRAQGECLRAGETADFCSAAPSGRR